ncbi:hypothetical protein Tco_0593496 [Tanacetum coccineum]
MAGQATNVLVNSVVQSRFCLHLVHACNRLIHDNNLLLIVVGDIARSLARQQLKVLVFAAMEGKKKATTGYVLWLPPWRVIELVGNDDLLLYVLLEHDGLKRPVSWRGSTLILVFAAMAGDDDNVLFSTLSLPRPITWLGNHTECVIAALSGVRNASASTSTTLYDESEEDSVDEDDIVDLEKRWGNKK